MANRSRRRPFPRWCSPRSSCRERPRALRRPESQTGADADFTGSSITSMLDGQYPPGYPRKPAHFHVAAFVPLLSGRQRPLLLDVIALFAGARVARMGHCHEPGIDPWLQEIIQDLHHFHALPCAGWGVSKGCEEVLDLLGDKVDALVSGTARVRHRQSAFPGVRGEA